MSLARPASSFRSLLAAALAGLFLAGCAPQDPLDAKLEAGDALGFSLWRAHHDSDLTPDQLETFNKALQEIRFHIMSAERTTGSANIEATLLSEIDGRPLREVLHLGLTWELQRATAEWTVLDDSLIKNSLMTSRPGDTESARYLADLHSRQVARLTAAASEITLTRARLAAADHLAGP